MEHLHFFNVKHLEMGSISVAVGHFENHPTK